MSGNPRVDAAPTRGLLQRLVDAGWNCAQLSREIGLTERTVWRICNGQPNIAAATAEAVAVFGFVEPPSDICPVCEDADWLRSCGVGFAEAAPRICTSSRPGEANNTLRRHLARHGQDHLADWYKAKEHAA